MQEPSLSSYTHTAELTHVMISRVAGILPPEWEAANRCERGASVQPEYSIWWSAVKYILKYRVRNGHVYASALL